MLKQLIYLILISAIVVFFIAEYQILLHHVASLHSLLFKKLSLIFAGGKIGTLIHQTLALFLIPVVLGFIPGIIYWLIKESKCLTFSVLFGLCG